MKYLSGSKNMPTALVLGGHGFIGREVVKALEVQGWQLVIGSRYAIGSKRKVMQLPLHKLDDAGWRAALEGVDIVVNAVGILRQRYKETYDSVHSDAPAAIAKACSHRGIALLHISALGLNNTQRSRFILSKIRGEQAVINASDRNVIIRLPLLEGKNGYGARWLRHVANWPLQILPRRATGWLAPMHVREVGLEIAKLAQLRLTASGPAIVEFGRMRPTLLPDYLDELRSVNKGAPLRFYCPHFLVVLVAICCDALHFSPFSYGHYELLQADTVPMNYRAPADAKRQIISVSQTEYS